MKPRTLCTDGEDKTRNAGLYADLLNSVCKSQSRKSATLFLQSSDLEPPDPQGSVSSPFGSGGGGGTFACGRGGGGVPIRTRGQTLWYVL
jgi:hypothetical protein